MIESSNIESEFKITTNEDGFETARDWLRRKFGGQYGSRSYARSCIYFDTPDRRLLDADVSFRRHKKKNLFFKYCLKVPIFRSKRGVVRRELFLRGTEAIDLLDPFDHTLAIIQQLLPYITENGMFGRDTVIGFKPAIKIQSKREFFPIFSDDGKRMVNIVFDRNVAWIVDGTIKREPVTWREIEIEGSHQFPEYSELSESVSDEICDLLGERFETLNKYAVAASLLGPYNRDGAGEESEG